VIRLLTPDDGPALAALYLRNRDYLAPFEPERPDSFFTAAVQRERLIRSAEASWWRWGIYDGDELAGFIALNDVMRGALQMGTLGYWVDEGHAGRGLATAAVRDVVAFAFADAALHRVEAGTLPDNTASQHVLEKNGFERFGYATRLLLIAGEWRDHVLFERVAD
jgi:ribosomal-protein-alanine N-acetyltransferase